jgi:Lrp/AsnC family leucine-responsive transcriptional regulator
MNDVDTQIIRLLQENARSTASEIGSKIGMSVSAVIERIKKLEGSGVISRYTTIIDHKKVGKDITALISVGLDHPKYHDAFVDFLNEEDDILECHYLAGDFDYSLKVITESTSSLQELLNRIKYVTGVSKTCTTIVLSTLKNYYSITPSSLVE